MFIPQSFDGQAAASRMYARGTAPYLSCLETVATAIKGDVSSDSPGSYLRAIDGWNRAPAARRHAYPDSFFGPAGSVGYGATTNRPDGHVWINLGDMHGGPGEYVVSTDWPDHGVIGVATITELVEDMRIIPLGWTDWFLGHNLINLGSTTTAGGGAKPLPMPSKEPVMNLIINPIDKKLYGIFPGRAAKGGPNLKLILNHSGQPVNYTGGDKAFCDELARVFGPTYQPGAGIADQAVQQIHWDVAIAALTPPA